VLRSVAVGWAAANAQVIHVHDGLAMVAYVTKPVAPRDKYPVVRAPHPARARACVSVRACVPVLAHASLRVRLRVCGFVCVCVRTCMRAHACADACACAWAMHRGPHALRRATLRGGGQVVNIHGGPWSRDQWGWNAEAQWFANRGYACIQVKARHAAPRPCRMHASMQVQRTARCVNHTPEAAARNIAELYRYQMGLPDDPVDTISMDEAEMLVESVIDHQCPAKDRSKWTFRVRFVGCAPDEDVWLSFAETN
jgi:hypothetical protein